MRNAACSVMLAAFTVVALRTHVACAGEAAESPVSVEIRTESAWVAPGEHVRLLAEVRPLVAGTVRYSWEASGGRFGEIDGAAAVWLAPSESGIYRIGVAVLHSNRRDFQEIKLSVGERRPDGAIGDHMESTASWLLGRQTLERRVGDLRAELARRGSYQDYLRAEAAREQLGFALLALERYPEALEIFGEPLELLPLGDPRRRVYEFGHGLAAFHLGMDREAIDSFIRSGDFEFGDSQYYLGRLHERRGSFENAAKAYENVPVGNLNFGDAAFRRATLFAEAGRLADATELLVTVSPVLGRAAILARLQEDDRLKGLLQSMRRADALNKLSEKRPLELSRPKPSDPRKERK